MERVKWNDLTPLQEDNLDYQPEEEEILEYASFIGLVLPEDNKYLYMAKEGLKAPLPPFWQACEGPQGNLFFRNRKTRVISAENPLDEIYIQKVRQIRQLNTPNNIFSIAEESALNQSSGLIKSRPKPDPKASGNNVPSQPHRILERHITEQSLYSEPSAERPSPGRSELQEEPLWKVQQNRQIQELRARIQQFVPDKKQLIAHASELDSPDLKAFVRPEDAAKLAELRMRVQQERSRLEQRKRERRELQTIMDNIRKQSQSLQ